MVETDVHYPTDVNLLWDAMRCLVRATTRGGERYGVRGWRQWRHLTREVRKLFNRVRSTRRAKRHPERVEAYLARCRALVERAVETLDALRHQGADTFTCCSIEGFVAHARRQIDQVERRLLRDETIPHEEKVFSIFEEHTRWISKGKAGTPAELGVPVAVVEDQYQFILHHKILWEGEDVDVAVPMVQEAQALYPELRACSFDRGFHSPDNRVRLDGLLDVNALPSKDIFRRPTRSGKRKSRFWRRGVRIRRSSLPSMDWSIADSTVFEAMARTGLRARLPCQCWRPTCIASGCFCRSGSANDDNGSPDSAGSCKYHRTTSRHKTAGCYCPRIGRPG